jgi:hypothetical protein
MIFQTSFLLDDLGEGGLWILYRLTANPPEVPDHLSLLTQHHASTTILSAARGRPIGVLPTLPLGTDSEGLTTSSLPSVSVKSDGGAWRSLLLWDRSKIRARNRAASSSVNCIVSRDFRFRSSRCQGPRMSPLAE